MFDLPTPEMVVHDVAVYLHLDREISFTRYSGRAKPMRTLGKIRVGFLVLEQETDELVHEIVGRRVRLTMHRARLAGE